MSPRAKGKAWSMNRTSAYRYAIAVLAAIGTLQLRAFLTPWIEDRPVLVLFVLPIALSAYLGGFGPGCVCTLIVTAGAFFLGLHSPGAAAAASHEDIAQLVLLLLVGIVVSAMNVTGSSMRATSDLQADEKLAGAFRKVQGGLAFALTCLIVISGVSYFSLARLSENARMVNDTREVLDLLREMRADATEIEIARSAEDPGSRELVAAARRSMRESSYELSRLTADNPAQRARLERIRPLLGEAPLTDAVHALPTTTVGSVLGEMISAEKLLLAARESQAQQSGSFARAVIVAGGALAFVIVGWALFAIRRDFISRLHAEAQLDRFFSLSLDFLCISSVDGYFKRVSPAVTSILGWSVEEFLREPYLDLIHPDDHEATLREVERQMRTGQGVLEFENRYRHKDGSWRVLSWRSMPQPDGLMYATARDVTNLKAAESALRDANDTLEDRVAARTEELARANEALDLTARGLQDQLARLALLSRITRAIGERQDIRSVYDVVVRALEEQLPADFACILRYDEADASFSVETASASTTSLASAARDAPQIDARSSALAACLQGESVYDGRLAASQSPFLMTLSRAGLSSLMAVPLSTEGSPFGVLLTGRCAVDGFAAGEREFLMQFGEHVALTAHQAKLYGALQNAYDDLRLSQQTVLQQERLRVLGQMASGIAHDINNSLSPVMLYAKLLERERNLSDSAREYLRIMQQSVHDIGDTVARMREFYRPAEPGQQFAAILLNTLVSQVVHLTRARWMDIPQQRGVVIRVQLELTAHLPAVRGVESEIREALTNLVFNAVDAMPDGGTITLRTGVEQADASSIANVHVEVIDTGSGMDPETRRRCLEPFFTTKGARGSGLGLAMVYGMLQRHGGSLAVASEVGAGTRVRMTFPATSARDATSSPEQDVHVRPLRILVVDDDPVLLKSMEALLQAELHSVVAVDGGQEAVETFKAAAGSRHPFDVVITDLGMPYVDGRQVAASVKAAAADTPVIMLTGWGRLMGEADIPPHVDRLLSKPPRIRELNVALAELTRPARAGEPRVDVCVDKG